VEQLIVYTYLHNFNRCTSLIRKLPIVIILRRVCVVLLSREPDVWLYNNIIGFRTIRVSKNYTIVVYLCVDGGGGGVGGGGGSEGTF